jgi:hypothetical protein
MSNQSALYRIVSCSGNLLKQFACQLAPLREGEKADPEFNPVAHDKARQLDFDLTAKCESCSDAKYRLQFEGMLDASRNVKFIWPYGGTPPRR